MTCAENFVIGDCLEDTVDGDSRLRQLPSELELSVVLSGDIGTSGGVFGVTSISMTSGWPVLPSSCSTSGESIGNRSVLYSVPFSAESI